MKQISIDELRDKTVSTFVFFYRSSKVPPGKGNKENASHSFEALEKIPDFRQQLSNFYPCRIVDGDGREFPSAEHYFHAEKMAMIDVRRAKLFETGKMYGKMLPSELRSLTGKARLNMGDKLEEWEKRVPEVLKHVWELKFTQNEKLKTMLLATMDARLVHFAKRRGSPAVYEHWVELEVIREGLS